MKPVRTAARALLASYFVVSGIRTLRNPEAKVAAAKPVTDRTAPLIARIDPRLPTDARTQVRVKAGADVAAGLLLASGNLTRPAAAVLAAGLLPATITGSPAHTDRENGLLTNLALLGGLLLAAVDTQGKPSLGYRTSHAVDRSQHTIEQAVRRSRRSMRRAVRTARREAKIAATARKLPG